MGLDSAELIHAIENSFEICIDNEEASGVRTVGELCELVIGKLEKQDSQKCLTSAAFYRVRSALTSELGIERRSVKPSTLLAPLIPSRDRRQKWPLIARKMGLNLPKLRHSTWLQLSCYVVGIGVAMLPLVFGMVSWKFVPSVLALSLLGFAAAGLFLRFSPTLAIALPKERMTVGDLSKDVVALNHAKLIEQVRGWNEREVWETICRLIMILTGIKRDKLTPEAAIVGDLGID